MDPNAEELFIAGEALDAAGVPRWSRDWRELSLPSRIRLLSDSRDYALERAKRSTYWLGVVIGIELASIVVAGLFTYYRVVSQ